MVFLLQKQPFLILLLGLLLVLSPVSSKDFKISNRGFDKIFDMLESQYFAQTVSGTSFLSAEEHHINSDNSDESDLTDGYVPVMALDYYGSWNSTYDGKNFDVFTKTKGFAHFVAFEDSSDDLDIDNDLVFWIYDGQYVD